MRVRERVLNAEAGDGCREMGVAGGEEEEEERAMRDVGLKKMRKFHYFFGLTGSFGGYSASDSDAMRDVAAAAKAEYDHVMIT